MSDASNGTAPKPNARSARSQRRIRFLTPASISSYDSPVGATDSSPRRKPWVNTHRDNLTRSLPQPRRGVRTSYAPTGLGEQMIVTSHGSRHGLSSYAATRLAEGRSGARRSQTLHLLRRTMVLPQ